MRRRLVTLLATLALVYAGFCGLLFFAQRSLIYFPAPRLGTGEVETLARPGATVAVSVRPRPGPAAAIYFGGNAEAVVRSLPELAAAFPERALYLLHYRGYAASDGSPSEAALLGDALALFDRVHSRHPEVVVVGRSLGAAIAVHVAAARPAERVVLVTPFDSLAGIAAAHYWFLPVRWLLRDRYEAWRDAPKVAAPTDLLVAAEDEIVPRARAEALLRQFRPGVATWHELAGVGHNTISASPDFLPLLRGSG